MKLALKGLEKALRERKLKRDHSQIYFLFVRSFMVLTPILRSFDKLLFSKTISVVAIRVPRQLCHTVQYVCSSELFDIVELSFRIIYFEIHITRVFNWILHQMKIVLYY